MKLLIFLAFVTINVFGRQVPIKTKLDTADSYNKDFENNDVMKNIINDTPNDLDNNSFENIDNDIPSDLKTEITIDDTSVYENDVFENTNNDTPSKIELTEPEIDPENKDNEISSKIEFTEAKIDSDSNDVSFEDYEDIHMRIKRSKCVLCKSFGCPKGLIKANNGSCVNGDSFYDY